MNQKRVFPEFYKQGSGNRCLWCNGRIRLNTASDRAKCFRVYKATTRLGWICGDCVEEPPEEVS